MPRGDAEFTSLPVPLDATVGRSPKLPLILPLSPACVLSSCCEPGTTDVGEEGSLQVLGARLALMLPSSPQGQPVSNSLNHPPQPSACLVGNTSANTQRGGLGLS